jgi:ubiquinone/menaquinone biosynthesis C-methylase UbiE
MEILKLRQREIYEREAVELSPLRVSLDRFGFTYGIRLKEIKLKGLLSIMKIHPEANVLDIGCGSGRFLNKLNAQYKTQRNIGADISLRQLKFNLSNNPHGNLYCLVDAEALPFKDSCFDYIFCFDTFEHLPNPGACIKDISRVLKPQGKILLCMLNQRDRYTWHWFLRIISCGKLGVDRGYWGEHNKENFLVAEDILNECKDNLLKVNKIVYFHSFFTLMFDEIYSFLLSFTYSKSPKPKIKKGLVNNSAKFKIASFLVKTLFYTNSFLLIFLESLDKLWTDKGYSNSFFILAQK